MCTTTCLYTINFTTNVTPDKQNIIYSPLFPPFERNIVFFPPKFPPYQSECKKKTPHVPPAIMVFFPTARFKICTIVLVFWQQRTQKCSKRRRFTQVVSRTPHSFFLFFKFWHFFLNILYLKKNGLYYKITWFFYLFPPFFSLSAHPKSIITTTLYSKYKYNTKSTIYTPNVNTWLPITALMNTLFNENILLFYIIFVEARYDMPF